ncbi:hypothetical protein LTR35_007145 [Friedmanniomyces endolithicus]|uniref:N-acetyltransferase domain-containing protein n=1 Tax=Friedmanniomyces endolithicus TaxID=329885 RepID=A0AAN6J690_9PEZI|nr:hypothetical protein LTR35_007145 [Friedmanniomyces endolithicus]KAK0290035.1 hypothetical protein LTS00_008865 [Friedmanniomyces endolithicus]KAK0318431.1 hypothetical protein LTR82_010492 [Friedmanniomyces endolithicus]
MDKSTAAAAFTITAEKPAVTATANSKISNQPNNSGMAPGASAGASSGGVRILQLSEWKEAAASLAEAFADDHTCTYFLNTADTAHWTEQKKWALHVKMMEYIVYAHLLKGLVVSAGPNYDCVGLWMPPGENMDDYLTIFRSGMWRLNYQLSWEGQKRFFSEFLPLLHDTKAQVLAERDYTIYIGTRPSGRGKGHARKVIEYVTGIADAAGRACYLESSNEVNRIIYGKLGFERRKIVYLQRAEQHVELDIMVREPVLRKGGVGARGGVKA